MLDRADERGWTTIRVNGSEEFKRQAWIQAEARGINALGYEPTQGDRVAAGEQRATLEQVRGAGMQRAAGGNVTHDTSVRSTPQESIAPIDRSGPEPRSDSTPEAGKVASPFAQGAVFRAFEAAMDAKRIPEADRVELRETFRQELSARQERGERFGVRVYDPMAERQHARATSASDPQQAHTQTDPSTRARRSPRPSH
jgi:hypothetical protein